MIEKSLVINLQDSSALKKVYTVQGDSGRNLKCIISDSTLGSGLTARIYAVKPSGKEIYNSCTIGENYVTVPLTTQTLSEVGTVKCQIEISKDEDDKVTSFEFDIIVEESLVSSSAIESSNEYSSLEKLIASANKATSSAKSAATKANNAATAANTATENANEATTAANNAADAANTAASDANTAATKATTAATNADTATSAANTAATNATNAYEKLKDFDVPKMEESVESSARPNMLLESNVANRDASSTTYHAASYVYENTSEIEVGVNYTVSVNVTSEDGCRIQINREKNGYKIGEYPVEAGTQTLTVNFVYSQSQKDALGDSNEIRIYQNAATGDWSSTNLTTVVVNWIKLEKGTIASDWCPAKSEMLSSIQYPTLTEATPTSTSEILVGDSTNNAVKKSTLSSIFSVIANTLTASALTTTAKTIVGAINELKTSIATNTRSISTINTSLSNKSNVLATLSTTVTNQTAEAGSTKTTAITVTKSGYTLLGVVGYHIYNSSSSGAQSSTTNVYACYKAGENTVAVNWRNIAEQTAAKVDIEVITLWVKS